MTDCYKILTVVGARPQFIKAAVISRALRKTDFFNEIIVHTGQHYDANMSEVFFRELDIPQPNYNLSIGNLSHGAMTGRMMEEIEKVAELEKPEFILVYGDTNSTLAGALVARKIGIKLIHIEAGLRSFDMKMPEEINRILTDRISDLLFCPTETAVKNLQKEGFENFPCRIINSGDVMYDAVLFYQQAGGSIESDHRFSWLPEEFALCTIHRAENTEDRKKLANIFDALEVINSHTLVVLPLHPRTRRLLENYNIKSSVKFIDPVGYLEMLYLLNKCKLVLTDSGGLQKEAYFLKKFCVTLRDTTEWTELIENKVNFLAGSDKAKILECYEKSSSEKSDFSSYLYGDGKAGEKIVADIKNAVSPETVE